MKISRLDENVNEIVDIEDAVYPGENESIARLYHAVIRYTRDDVRELVRAAVRQVSRVGHADHHLKEMMLDIDYQIRQPGFIVMCNIANIDHKLFIMGLQEIKVDADWYGIPFATLLPKNYLMRARGRLRRMST